MAKDATTLMAIRVRVVVRRRGGGGRIAAQMNVQSGHQIGRRVLGANSREACRMNVDRRLAMALVKVQIVLVDSA